MTKHLRLLATLIAMFALAFVVAACGDDEESSSSSNTTSSSETPSSDSGTAITKDPANEGKKITVGSKNFAEQFILGEIYAQALEAAGFDVEKELNLGSEQIAYKALQNGNIDAYPEYSGTALTSFYDVKTDDVPRDKDEAFKLLEEKAKADGITALPQTPFQNTYVITSTVKKNKEFDGAKTISELAKAAGDDVKLSGFPECRQRTDCLLGLRDLYGWEPKFVSSQGKFADIDAGQADLTFAFGTDGELAQTDKYATYEDDKQLFPPYYISFLVNDKGMQALGDSGQEVIEKIQEPLTEEVMAELNSRVTIDKEEPEDVAAFYLKEAGFVK